MIPSVPLQGRFQFEHPILNTDIYYERLEIVPNQPTAVYVFHNVVINPFGYKRHGGVKGTIELKGIWYPVLDYGKHYGHYIKEGVGGFVYCKNIFTDLKPICFELMTTEPTGTIGASGVISELNNELLSEFGDPKHHYKGHVFLEKRFIIEKLVVMMDNGRALFKKQYPYFLEHMAPHVSKAMIKHFKKYKIDDPSYPKKIYITRKRVTQAIKRDNLDGQAHFKNRYFHPWVEDAIEQAFIDQGYSVIDFSDMPFKDQIKYPHNATHFASITGTAFHNGIWCENGTTFYAIRPNNGYLFDWEHDIVRSLSSVRWNYIDPWDSHTYAEMYDFITKKITDT